MWISLKSSTPTPFNNNFNKVTTPQECHSTMLEQISTKLVQTSLLYQEQGSFKVRESLRAFERFKKCFLKIWKGRISSLEHSRKSARDTKIIISQMLTKGISKDLTKIHISQIGYWWGPEIYLFRSRKTKIKDNNTLHWIRSN